MKIRFPVAVVAVLLCSGAIGWALSRTQSLPTTEAQGPTVARPVRHTRVLRLPRGWSFIAVARSATLRVYRHPHRGPSTTLSNQLSAGAPLSLLVRRLRGHWIEVYLPIRPDGSTGWVPARSVRLVTTAYEITVRLRSHRLVLAAASKIVRTFPIGVGRSVTPTPTGTYFITELLKQPDPNGFYGPFAFGLSAYSTVLTNFSGGPGQVASTARTRPSWSGLTSATAASVCATPTSCG